MVALALGRGDVQLARTLVSKGARIAGTNRVEEDERGRTALEIAVEDDDVAMVDLLLSKRADPNERLHSDDYATAAFMAIGGGDRIAMLKSMIRHGARFDIPSPYPAVYVAVDSGSPQALALVIAAKAPLNALAKTEKQTALHLAVRDGADLMGTDMTRKVIEVLLKAGANRHIKDGEGKEPWQYADEEGVGKAIYRALRR
jgi:ankyrin repeat protein